MSGKTPSLKDILKISARNLEISGLKFFNILTGMLLGHADLD